MAGDAPQWYAAIGRGIHNDNHARYSALALHGKGPGRATLDSGQERFGESKDYDRREGRSVEHIERRCGQGRR